MTREVNCLTLRIRDPQIDRRAVTAPLRRSFDGICDFYHATGRRIGMKPAGGISTAKQAIQYLVLVRETLGQDWLTPDLFRLGASRLANDILMQIAKQQSGVDQSLDYFAND